MLRIEGVERRRGTKWGTTVAVERGLARTLNDEWRRTPKRETRISRRGRCFGAKKSTSAALPTAAHDRLRIAVDADVARAEDSPRQLDRLPSCIVLTERMA
jgi:hypothetical protein